MGGAEAKFKLKSKQIQAQTTTPLVLSIKNLTAGGVVNGLRTK
jgi:hypothetical protein